MKQITKLVLNTILLGSTAFSTQAQILNAVKWTYAAQHIKENIYEVKITAEIEQGWNIYSQTTPGGGPLPTTITFNKNTNVQYGGKTKEIGTMKKKHEAVFGVDVHYYTDSVTFVQLVKLKKKQPTKLSGTVEFMACDATKCLPPDEVEFAVELK